MIYSSEQLFRETAFSVIKNFLLPEGTKPEKYLHSLIIGMDEAAVIDSNEIIEVAKEIVVVDDDHKYVDDIIERLGWERPTGLSKIVDLVATTNEWEAYIAELYQWLNSKVPDLREDRDAA